ncbi:50S ribosomal protein L23 [Fibrobacter sp. UWB1]|jgi:large subunit ribosomal protein L23|uniref:50S ribosomal protein L23 n=1 Tax=Fibrobacter TaxID=832 RepID=UPI00090F9E61|nr:MULTISPECIES: 50S ribosomal protein L23 [Fibrobacter]OWV13899.1 50S ribosomal protein L23 [Fibrobacter sp. UWB5]OWV24840.1 50S ribosomal protein L23 [Fibrobacter sp. UWB1]SHL51372.1 LSU ribosomal protein L23P [Fibrobacter sp. UWOV1]
MSELHEILVAPHITEATARLMAAVRNDVHKYVFKVAKTATKTEIKDAIEKRFGVKVDSVNTLINRGKMKRVRMGMVAGKKSNWKKAYITLKAGQKIAEFEGV